MGVLWKGNISTNVKCGITAYITWHIVLYVRCVMHRRVMSKAFNIHMYYAAENKKEKCEGSGGANVMKWGKNFIWYDIYYSILYTFICMHMHVYCHMNYIHSWAHNGLANIYCWVCFFARRFQRDINRYTAAAAAAVSGTYTSHAY